ncbi:conserved hypothetical protein [gamma proteobacterium HTCC5015]|nr:conserved hypothetical protein [gamma proteobacterium HTCC5015]
MDTAIHTLSELFEQLGLASDSDSIDRFIAEHRPLDDNTPLADAPFWNRGQASFLREAIVDDANWAELVDQLNAQLR